MQPYNVCTLHQKGFITWLLLQGLLIISRASKPQDAIGSNKHCSEEQWSAIALSGNRQAEAKITYDAEMPMAATWKSRPRLQKLEAVARRAFQAQEVSIESIAEEPHHTSYKQQPDERHTDSMAVQNKSGIAF